MNIDFKFPNMSNYDITKPGDMALYHAHSDLYPFKGLIETTEFSIRSTANTLHDRVIDANEKGDMYKHSEAAMHQGIYMMRVAPLSYSSIVLMMVSILEEAFNTACRCYQLTNEYPVKLKDIAQQGLERAIIYLDKIAGVKGIKNDPQWEFIKTIRDARNMIVHNGGRINGDTSKFEKFNFYIREEDKQLQFDYETLINMYDGIIDFVDRVFKIEPTA